MKTLLNRSFKTMSLLILLLVLYTIFRFCFYLFNKELFDNLNSSQLISIFTNGIRYDLSLILIINILFILLSLLPFSFQYNRAYKTFLILLFIIPNCIAFLFEISDWIYFEYNHKRATADVLHTISRKGDFLGLLPSFMKSYWFLFVIAAIVIVIFIYLTKKIINYFDRITIPFSNQNRFQFYSINSIGIIIIIGLSIIGIRGGMQLMPISIRNAVEVAGPQNTALVLNTPFSIIKTLNKGSLIIPNYMSDAEALQYIRPIKQYPSNSFQKKNVVFIILESFSKEYTSLGLKPSYTPFLDSLMTLSYVCTQAYANGLHSVDGVPAILSGIPALMSDPFTTSIYSNNKTNSIASILKKEGYQTAFFHGSTNGSWAFDVYAQAAGFDAYYGRTEYNNDKDYDGSWGIPDHLFLQYFLRNINQFKQPFCVSEFTLTSHGPYTLPDAFKNKFPKGTLQIHETIGYTDYSLRKFFEEAQKQPWYKNTLFVISADHCSPLSMTDYYRSKAGRYQIPIIYFDPSNPKLRGTTNVLTQEIDILPSVLQYLGYQHPFFALGNSIFDSTAIYRCVLNQTNDVFEMETPNYLTIFSNGKMLQAYHYPNDSLQAQNLMPTFINSPAGQDNLKLWQAFIQTFTKAVVNDKMTVK